jgi:uncharacterized protein DUF6929
VWQLQSGVRNERGPALARMTPVQRAHLTARFDARRAATLDELVALRYERPAEGLPGHVRAASALRRFENRLVIVQDDVRALAVRDSQGSVRPVLLPPHASGARVFGDEARNKREKLDLEACVVLPDGRFVAFGSGATPARERLVLLSGRHPPAVLDAAAFYGALRAAVVQHGERINIEGAVVSGQRLMIFHRGNDRRAAGATNAIAELDSAAFASWLDGRAPPPLVTRLTTVDLGAERGVPFGFTDAAAVDDDRVVVLACAEDAPDAIADGPVLGCRVGLLAADALTLVAVHDASGRSTTLKLEGIEPRPGSDCEFDVAIDVDRASAPALLGRLVWEWR